MAVTTNLSVLPPHLHLGFFGSELSRRSQERGYSFFVEGYIHAVRFSGVSQTEVTVSGGCYRSMKKNEKPHKLHVIIEIAQRCFKLAHCSCQAGQSGKCSHLVALVNTLINYQQQGIKEVPGELSSTSLPQQWHKPRGTKIRPQHIKSMVFAKAKPKDKRKKGPVVPAYEAQRVSTTSSDSIRKLQQLNGSALSYLLSPQREMCNTSVGSVQRGSMLKYQLKHFEAIVPTTGTVTPCGEVLFPGDTPWEVKVPYSDCNMQCPITLNESHSLEKSTCKQSDCPLWYDARKHRVTASTFHKVTQRVKAVDGKFLDSLFKPSSIDTAAMSHGRNTESAAKASYLKDFPDRHLHDCGLVVNPKYSFLGASPDAKVCGNGVTGILEIKCPYHLGGEKFVEVAKSSRTFFLELIGGNLTLKKSHTYFSQIQGQLLVTGAPFCDLYVYSNSDTHCERIFADSQKCQEMLDKMSIFYRTHAMPYLSK